MHLSTGFFLTPSLTVFSGVLRPLRAEKEKIKEGRPQEVGQRSWPRGRQCLGGSTQGISLRTRFAGRRALVSQALQLSPRIRSSVERVVVHGCTAAEHASLLGFAIDSVCFVSSFVFWRTISQGYLVAVFGLLVQPVIIIHSYRQPMYYEYIADRPSE